MLGCVIEIASADISTNYGSRQKTPELAIGSRSAGYLCNFMYENGLAELFSLTCGFFQTEPFRQSIVARVSYKQGKPDVYQLFLWPLILGEKFHKFNRPRQATAFDRFGDNSSRYGCDDARFRSRSCQFNEVFGH